MHLPALPEDPRVGQGEAEQAHDQLAVPHERLQRLVQCVSPLPVLVHPVDTTHVTIVEVHAGRTDNSNAFVGKNHRVLCRCILLSLLGFFRERTLHVT